MFFYHTLKKFLLPATIAYIVLVVLVNVGFSYLPFLHLFGNEVSPVDVFVGITYLVRDFAQRELRHYVLVAMLIGIILTYVLVDPHIAFASAAAFMAGELIDWLIFTFTQKPLSQRLLWSALISSPVDSSIFLACLHQLNWVSFGLLCLGKWIGVFALWYGWKKKN